MVLRDILAGYQGILECGDESLLDTEVRAVSPDSRKIESGDVFVAVPGEYHDGHDYIGHAISRGAVVVVIGNKAYRREGEPWILAGDSREALGIMKQNQAGRPSLKMGIIGVTGTNGKTTVSNMIASILEEAGKKIGLIGTIHNRVANRVFETSLTTPDSGELADLLGLMAEEGADYVVMEVSSHALDQRRVAGIEFDLAVFTNLSQDHLDYHGSADEYFKAKARLFTGLRAQGEKKRVKAAVLNLDDKVGVALADYCEVSVISYGLGADCCLRAADIELSPAGLKYTVLFGKRAHPISMRLHGRFNVYNSLAAIAVALTEKIDIEVIVAALEKMAPVPGRFQQVIIPAGADGADTGKASDAKVADAADDDKADGADAGKAADAPGRGLTPGLPFQVYIDYSHTPDSLEKCVNTAREMSEGKVICVFGAGGHRDATKRPLMGEAAARLADIAIVTSDNPRDEDPVDIINDILKGVTGPSAKAEVMTEPDRAKAIALAVGLAGAGDIVLICGKGHEDYQIIGDSKHAFNDYEQALEAMLALMGAASHQRAQGVVDMR